MNNLWILCAGLWISFLSFFLLYLVGSKYKSPLVISNIDTIRQRVDQFLTKDNKRIRLQVMAKHAGEVVNTALLIGLGFGVIFAGVGWVFVGWWGIFAGVFGAILGIIIADILIQNEFKQLQEKFFIGVPALITFMPSFLGSGVVTPREAMQYTVPFVPQPLRKELEEVVDKIKRTGNVRGAFNDLTTKIQHPCIDALCSRLSSVWEAEVEVDLFDDLADQIEDAKEIAITSATVNKSGIFVLLLLLGMLIALILLSFAAFMWVRTEMQFF